MMYMSSFIKISLLLIAFFVLTGCGGGGNSDGDGSGSTGAVDSDHDGLIEITSLRQLDWMRNDLKGQSLNDGAGNVSSEGCPNTGCNGYELNANLNFDTNGDGVIDQNDDYYNEGKGWMPIGSYAEPFAANFEGNNHVIRNLYINRDASDPDTAGEYVGLFGYVESLIGIIHVRNIKLDGALFHVSGFNNTGGLAGAVHKYVQVVNASAKGSITGLINTGGLIGAAIDDVEISRSNDGSNVAGIISTGGLVGAAANNTQIKDSQTSSTVSGKGNTGGLVGNADQDVLIRNCVSVIDVTGDDYQTGGLVGSATTSTIDASRSEGNVVGYQETGGLVGDASVTTTVTNSQSTATVDGGVYTHVLVGRIDGTSTITNSTGSGGAPLDTDGDHQPDLVDVDDDNDGLIEIASLEQLDWVRNDLSGRSLNSGNGNPDTTGCPAGDCVGYELVTDLDFDTNGDGVNDFLDDYYDYYGNGTDIGWLPLGDSTTPFTGHFEGNGYTVAHIFINSDANGIGMFGFVDGVIINDVHLTGVSITSLNDEVAGLVGHASNSSITNSSVDGDVSGHYVVGGLVGTANQVTVTSSSAAGNVSGDFAVGGLIGNVNGSSIIDSSTNSEVSGNNNVGGLAGYLYQNVTIQNSIASGNASGQFTVGGLVGVTGTNGIIDNSHTSGDVTGERWVDVLAGYIDPTAVITNSDGTGNGPPDIDGDHQPDAFDVDDDNDGLIEIATLEQLDWVRNDLTGATLNDGINFPSSVGCPYSLTAGFVCNGYELIADLDFDADDDGVIDDPYYNVGMGWEPIGSSDFQFSANFNGNGHRISNLYVNRPGDTGVGLFAYVRLKVAGSDTISNVILDGPATSVTGLGSTGGLAGDVQGFTISNVYFSGVINGAYQVGGLIGLAESQAEIVQSHTAGDVTAGDYGGGLIGEANNSVIIYNSFSTSAVNGTTINDLVSPSSSRIGGLIGYTSSGVQIDTSFSTGTVTVTGSYVGGLIGLSYNTSVSNAFSTSTINGDLTFSNYVGGLIGDANAGTVVDSSFATGAVTGIPARTGALVGWSDGASYVDDYFANDIVSNAIGTVNNAGSNSIYTGAPLADLQAATYAGASIFGVNLFSSWGAEWDFGDTTQLPGLIIDGQIYRDGNSDGTLD